MKRTRGDQYQGKLKIGQKVYSGLYGGRYGVVAKISGEQTPATIKRLGGGVISMGGNATIDVVYEDYALSKGIPESIVLGVQWEIIDEIENYSEVLKLIERAEEMRRGEEIARAIKAVRSAKEFDELPAKYPHLTPSDISGKKSIITAASNIRKELKAAYPHIKFSVVSRHGSSIDISWTDGPTSESINAIVKKYQEGSFDGMIDCYEYSTTNFNRVFGGARYVFCNRTESKETLVKVAALYGWALEFDQWGSITNLNGEDSQRVYREARQTTT